MRILGNNELARAAGYTPGYISRVARGQRTPSLRCVGKLASAMGISASQLVKMLEMGKLPRKARNRVVNRPV